MANQCSLYAVDFVPGEGEKTNLLLLGEYAYDIPLVFKLLISASPRICPSLDWPGEGEVAILGDLTQGHEQLFAFLDQLTHPLVEPLIEETKAFLTRPEFQLPYVLLEPFDIFQMSESDFFAATSRLLEEIQLLDERIPTEVETTLTALLAPISTSPKRLWPWQKTQKPRDPLQPLYDLGLGSWG
ncbi:hypothetical protein [Armatimonas sp.]|uniref:DUF7822 domain-containing protein n=1 Tax=Armatimonas sp. TaxID=1872638 RepID=UPI00286D0B5E|nr:hypothetical protein [Armatimonas sp.]